MLNCAKHPIAFAGYGTLNALLEKVQGATLIKPGNTFTATTFISAATWRTLIAAVAGMNALPLSTKRGYENTTEDLPLETSNLGMKEKTDDPLPSMIGYLEGSYCDYKTIKALDGQSFDVVLHLKNGVQYASQNAALAVKGFRATIYTRHNLPLVETRQNSYPVYIVFDSIEEFENDVVAQPPYTFRTILDYRPAGLNVVVTTVLTTDTIIINVTNRSDGTPKTGLLAADFEIIATNAPDVNVDSIVDNLDGSYDLVVQRLSGSVPADLEAGEFAWIQTTADDATYITFAGNQIKAFA